ncbi:MAG: SusC/RagA family TonB-linked outer membrane protein [Prevotellaceae bacterium]|jgi:TonB-linked SusC/RagA family outer membrane protein|nr:SusC/RagA family TonB-linked outer membrane protein [Prevotellaceae bacterium]
MVFLHNFPCKALPLALRCLGQVLVLLCLMPLPVAAQNLSISGGVVDSNRDPLVGVSVVVKGAARGATTDVNGSYSIQAPANAVLVFSFMGMATKEEPVNGRVRIDVTLSEDDHELEEVVVTGYQSIDKHLFTGSVATLKASDALTDGVADISRSLQGKAAGVQVQNVSGTFGASPKLRVRGASSIHGNQKPLWVVDGIALEDVVEVSPDDLSSGNPETLISSAIAGLSADDIESFQILKDAAATSLYGARAMNGVIVITTKKGRQGTLRVNYTGEFTTRLKPSYRNYNIMNSQEQMMIYQELEEKGRLNYADVSRSSNGGVYRKMYDLINTWDATKGQFGIPNTSEAKAKFLQQYETINTDWFDVLFTNSLQQSHSVNISSGTERSRYYGSLSYYGDDGWAMGENVQRFTGNANASFDVGKYVAVNLLSTSSIRLQQAPGTNNRSVSASDGAYSRSFDINPFSYSLNTSRVMRPYDDEGNYEYYVRSYAPFNIINELENNTLDIKMMDTKLQGELEAKPIRGLSIKAIGSFRYVMTSREHKVNENSNYAMAYRANEDSYVNGQNGYLYRDPDNVNLPKVVVVPFGGFYNRNEDDLLSYNERAMATYDFDFLEDHKVNILAGQELRYVNRGNSYSRGVGYQWERGGVPFVDYLYFKQMTETGEQYYGYKETYERFSSFFAKLSYSYAGRYVLNATGRYDGSNKLGRSRSARWLPTWSLSGAWHVNEERFFGDFTKAVPQLTVRISHSLAANMPGNVSNATTVFYNDITSRSTDLDDRENRIYISQLENSELTWEKLNESNLGLDIGVLNNRISLSIDGYFRQSFDLIGDVRTSAVGGQLTKKANYADMEIYGTEFTLNTKNVDRKDFSWTTNLTFAYNHSEITKLEGFPRVIDLVGSAGYPVKGYPQRGLFSIPFMGLNEEGLPQTLNEKGEITVGNVRFDENENTAYLKYEGPIDPPVMGGFENAFKYKGLRLSVYLSYQFGNVIRLDEGVFKSRYSDLNAMPREFSNRWMLPGDEAYTSIPVIASVSQAEKNSKLTQAYNAYSLSDARVCDGSFIRLKDVTLSYDLPRRWIGGLGVETIQLRAIASNLVLLYSDKKLQGQDPEFVNTGGVAMPVPKQVTFSLRVGF